MVGGLCDFSVSPSPFGLDFGTSDFGLTIITSSQWGAFVYVNRLIGMFETEMKINAYISTLSTLTPQGSVASSGILVSNQNHRTTV